MLSGQMRVAPTGSSTKSLASGSERDLRKNPFKMPEDNNIFLIRNQEKARRKQELQRELGLRVHEKVTYAGRMNARHASLRKELLDGSESDTHTHSEPNFRETPAWRVAMIKDRSIDKESISEYITKKRELFLMEYSLAVKRGEIEQLEDVAADEERKLVQAEKFLRDDALLFDEFLKENDKNSVEAIKIAEQETKLKLEKVMEIKRITTKMVATKSDISRYEDTMKEYVHYKDFLFQLSPPDWQEKQRAKARTPAKAKEESGREEEREKEREKEKERGKEKERERKTSLADRRLPPLREARVPSRHSMKSTPQNDKSTAASGTHSDSSEYEEEPELYFSSPQELLNLLTELEEQNLSLIQNSRETEESLEEFRQNMVQTKKKMELESDQLRQQIDIMTHTIQREQEHAAELELKARLFNFGKYKSEDQDGTLDTLGSKVEVVYRGCVGHSEANLSTLQMLTAIEGRLGDLLENVEMIPRDRLVLAERAKEKERRLRLRDEKIRQQKQHQEERLKKALERAHAEIKKTSGKKLMARSQPPARKLKLNQNNDITDREKEEQLYFFT